MEYHSAIKKKKEQTIVAGNNLDGPQRHAKYNKPASKGTVWFHFVI